MNGIDARISTAVAQTRLSAIKEMAMLSAQIPDAVSLAWGLPSFNTPEHIREAVRRALVEDPDVGKYALPNGLATLRHLVVKTHRKKTGVSIDADANVLITAGNIEGMQTVLRTLLNPGDEVIVTDPGFTSHFQQIRLNGGVPVAWPLDESAGWQLNPARLEQLITPRTKALILVNPCNPTGTLFDKTTLLECAGILQRNGIVAILDDPYSEFTFENRSRFFNLARHKPLFENLAYLVSFSKTHAMSGWRLGYMIVPQWLRASALAVHDATMICAPRIAQIAGIEALNGGDAHVREFELVLARRRNLICERLDRLPHVFDYQRPAGTYYVFPRLVIQHNNDREFALDVLQKAHVAMTPGSAFGKAGEHHVRMAFCVEDETINSAFDRLEKLFQV